MQMPFYDLAPPLLYARFSFKLGNRSHVVGEDQLSSACSSYQQLGYC